MGENFEMSSWPVWRPCALNDSQCLKFKTIILLVFLDQILPSRTIGMEAWSVRSKHSLRTSKYVTFYHTSCCNFHYGAITYQTFNLFTGNNTCSRGNLFHKWRREIWFSRKLRRCFNGCENSSTRKATRSTGAVQLALSGVVLTRRQRWPSMGNGK